MEKSPATFLINRLEKEGDKPSAEKLPYSVILEMIS